jgi:2-keto-4-pentenoate hydratase/2-oxohepta-3-ene-1,7-dioic acid hydratase in catechol pathway
MAPRTQAADVENRTGRRRIIGLPLRLVTFDRRGHRRLGALLEGEVVDLPDLIGHPAFPTTMEALVASNGGTVLDAAGAALERDEAAAFVVADARLLPPIVPTSLRGRDPIEAVRKVAGPGEVVPWPSGAAWLEFQPKVAAVLRRPLRNAGLDETARAVFGYTLVVDWALRDESGDPIARPQGMPVAIGPCVATPDEVDPQAVFLTVRLDGEDVIKGNLNGTARDLLGEVVAASRLEELQAGDAFALSPFASPALDPRAWPGAEIELDAEGIGTLRGRVGPIG